MNYYIMVCEGKHPIMPIASGPDYPGIWMDGNIILDDVPQPLNYILDSDYQGLPKAMYYEESIPLIRDDVIEVLKRAGVNNLQYFNAILYDPSSGTEYCNYKAYNIVGLVACADMKSSELMGTSDLDMGDIDFHALVIDESKTHELLLFRLAENLSAVVVHKKVKDAIENAGIPGFVFYGPGEWSG